MAKTSTAASRPAATAVSSEVFFLLLSLYLRCISALHFHLTIATDTAITNPKTPSGLSYEDTEFAYEPLLDANRDGDLMDILPDYLTEEICFPRNHAVKFYTKVVESMTKRVVVDED